MNEGNDFYDKIKPSLCHKKRGWKIWSLNKSFGIRK